MSSLNLHRLYVSLVSISFSVFLLFPLITQAATGDITGVRIHPDGWYAEVDIEGFVVGGAVDYGLVNDGVASTSDHDARNAKVIFTVTSEGYNDQGQLGTITRTVYGTKTVRKPYPDSASINLATHVPDEVVSGNTLTLKMALSDFIYNDDKAGGSGTSGTDVTVSIPSGWYTDSGSGGTGASSTALSNVTVTNNSVLDYPKVIGRWAWPGYERVTGDFLVEALAVHRFAQQGKPVAAVVFTAEDQSSHTTSATVTDIAATPRTGDANKVLTYAATMDIDALDQAETITVNFKAYPWVGDQDSVLDSSIGADGVVQPNEQLGPLYAVNDKDGTYGVGHALVSPAGNNATGQIYSSQSAAEAGNAFLTIGAAATALKAYHNISGNATPVRNSAGGGVILLAEGNHAYPGTVPSADLGAMNTWLTIKPASTASPSLTKITSGSTSALKANLVKIEGVSLSPSVPNNGGISGRAASDALWLHGNSIHATTTTPLYAWKAAYATQNQVTSLPSGFIANYGGTKGPFALVRGNNSTPVIKSHFYAVLGNKNVSGESFTEAPNPPKHATSSNAIFAFNSVYGMTSGVSIAETTETTGIALIQNVYERIGTYPGGLMAMSSGGGQGATTTNIITWHNTFVGERHQWGYNSEGTKSTPKLNYGSKYNYFHDQGTKTDTFGAESGTANGNRRGNWPLVYGVGEVADKSAKNSFPMDFNGLFSQRGPDTGYINVGFVDDRAIETGTGQGNGNYQLTPVSQGIDPVFMAESQNQVLPYDFLGNPRYGSSDTGAYEYQPPYTMGADELLASTSIRMYGDEKFRNKNGSTSNGVADLAISIPGNDRTNWIDVTVNEWNTSGTNRKVWTEDSTVTGLTNTAHTVGDLVAGTYYEVKVDGTLGQNISGATCESGVCQANGQGEIAFTYNGSYSTHVFEVEESVEPPVDTTAPTIVSVTSSTVNGTYTTGTEISLMVNFSEPVTSTSSVVLNLNTGTTTETCSFNVTASTTGSCTYTVASGNNSADLDVTSITGALADASGNVMVNFTPATTLAQNKNIVIDTADLVTLADPAEVTLVYRTSKVATCKYGTTAGVPFASMSNVFSSTASTTHRTLVLAEIATPYTYYVRCQDTVGNANLTDKTVSFTVSE